MKIIKIKSGKGITELISDPLLAVKYVHNRIDNLEEQILEIETNNFCIIHFIESYAETKDCIFVEYYLNDIKQENSEGIYDLIYSAIQYTLEICKK